ncbi:MAG: restriction endonuclease subunit S [Candidatus Cloacimonetes bacterium]|nr:restriction endonuclease subunit S [Candidatus Cloacimonadota bacterium]
MQLLVPLKEIFDIKRGTNLELNRLVLSSSVEGIPFVSRTSKNNGISAYVEEIDDVVPNEKHTLSVAVSGSVLETFYQDEKYYSGFHLFVLSPLMELTKMEMLIYCAYIRSNKYRFNYGRQANKTLGEIKVPAPLEIKKVSSRFQLIKKPGREPFFYKKFTLKDRKWQWFEYEGLFNIERGRGIRKNEIVQGNVRFVTSTDSNNGVTAFVDARAEHPGNVISVNRNGSVGQAFYQEKDFCSTEDVHVFLPKFPMNVEIGLFLCSLIRMEKYRFSYGRKWGMERMKKSRIKLPVDSNGNPDWQFMEDYIKSLPYSSNLN